MCFKIRTAASSVLKNWPSLRLSDPSRTPPSASLLCSPARPRCAFPGPFQAPHSGARSLSWHQRPPVGWAAVSRAMRGSARRVSSHGTVSFGGRGRSFTAGGQRGTRGASAGGEGSAWFTHPRSPVGPNSTLPTFQTLRTRHQATCAPPAPLGCLPDPLRMASPSPWIPGARAEPLPFAPRPSSRHPVPPRPPPRAPRAPIA